MTTSASARAPRAIRPASLAPLLCLLLSSAGASCTRLEPAREIELRGPTMGTTWSVKLVPGQRTLSATERDAIDRRIRDLLTRIEGLMSTWDESSELSRFNRSTSLDPFPVAPETFAVFDWAVRMAGETDGALDVTVLPIARAWGFGPGDREPAAPPDEASLVRLREATGIAHLELDPGGQWVRKRTPDVACDFSAIAPGYAADRIADLLAPYDLQGVLIDVGGELVARGRNAEDSPWRVAIEQPDAEARGYARVVQLENLAVATSGDYRNYREVNGRRIGHIIDPRTARPAHHRLASVTVVDASCTRADALATALMVLGPDAGLALAEQLDLAALLIVRTDDGFEERTTPRFDRLTSGGNQRGT